MIEYLRLVTVAGARPVAEVSERYLSFSVDAAQLVGGDFWDREATVLGTERVPPFDFAHPRLQPLVRALGPACLRLGGTDADRLYYDFSAHPRAEAPRPYRWVLTRERWDAAADFARAHDLQIAFTLNAGAGPRDRRGVWQPTQARALVEHAAERGDPVVLWELGNEVNAYSVLLGLHVSPKQYVADVACVRALLTATGRRAALGGPASAFWPILGEPNALINSFLEAGGDVDVLTWHYYPQQSRRCGVAVRPARLEGLLHPDHLDEIGRWAGTVEAAQQTHAPEAEIWIGETGNAQGGGEPGVSDVFVGGLWWLDQLGLMAKRGVRVMVRQSLAGANYGLLDDQMRPRPDYWNSLLWRRLMGTRVLDARAPSRHLRVYAHSCGPGAPSASPGAFTLLAINLASEPQMVAVECAGVSGGRMLIYALDAESLASRQVRLNGDPLAVDDDGVLPPLEPVERVAGPFLVPPRSYTFAVFPDANLPACR